VTQPDGWEHPRSGVTFRGGGNTNHKERSRSRGRPELGGKGEANNQKNSKKGGRGTVVKGAKAIAGIIKFSGEPVKKTG